MAASLQIFCRQVWTAASFLPKMDLITRMTHRQGNILRPIKFLYIYTYYNGLYGLRRFINLCEVSSDAVVAANAVSRTKNWKRPRVSELIECLTPSESSVDQAVQAYNEPVTTSNSIRNPLRLRPYIVRTTPITRPVINDPQHVNPRYFYAASV